MSKKMCRLWVMIATIGVNRGRPLCDRLQPADEARLIAALIAINATLARAARI